MSHLAQLPSLRRNYYRRIRAAFVLALGIHLTAFLLAPPYHPAPPIMKANPLRVISAGLGWAEGSWAQRSVSTPAGGATSAPTPSRASVLAGVLQTSEASAEILSEPAAGLGSGPETRSAADAGVGGGTGDGADEAPPTYYGYDTAPRALKTVEPAYPSMARAAGAEGTVVININLDERGRIIRAWVASASASELLIATALEAVYQFEFAPGRLRGVAVRSTVAVPFRFHLNRTS